MKDITPMPRHRPGSEAAALLANAVDCEKRTCNISDSRFYQQSDLELASQISFAFIF
jgi:hypothetical protein